MGTVTLSRAAPNGGAVVPLASSNANIAGVPPSVTIAAGATSASFSITTNRLKVTKSTTISGVFGGVTKTALLTVTAFDTITILRALYVRPRVLRVQATSSDPTAQLDVYVTATGAFIGTLTPQGDDFYSAQFSWPVNPNNITVRSSSGGSASSRVTVSSTLRE